MWRWFVWPNTTTKASQSDWSDLLVLNLQLQRPMKIWVNAQPNSIQVQNIPTKLKTPSKRRSRLWKVALWIPAEVTFGQSSLFPTLLLQMHQPVCTGWRGGEGELPVAEASHGTDAAQSLKSGGKKTHRDQSHGHFHADVQNQIISHCSNNSIIILIMQLFVESHSVLVTWY